eukprot:13450269-Heterocapsa_arctica.AAC.1
MRLYSWRGPRSIRLPGAGPSNASWSEELDERGGSGPARWCPDAAVHRFLVALTLAGLRASVTHTKSPLRPRGRG